MFERFTQGARRVIFFARYEASNYGSRYIETEHLLLGILREDRSLSRWFPGKSNVEPQIRAEIEKRITQGERISVSVEVPLTDECKRVLNLAAETAERLGHSSVEPEHLLIGILRVEESLAAQILVAQGIKQGPIQEQLGKAPSREQQDETTADALLVLESFLSGLCRPNPEELIPFFAKNARFIDASGKQWNLEEIREGFETLFAPYAKKNASYIVETTLARTGELVIASVLWKNVLLASLDRSWMQRMTVVLLREADEWKIVLGQVTPVQVSQHSAK